jgi:hypothetical protein
MVPILTRLVGDEVVIRKKCLCFRALVNCNSNSRGVVPFLIPFIFFDLIDQHHWSLFSCPRRRTLTRNKQRRHPPPPPRQQPTKHNKIAIVARIKSSNRSHNHPSFILPLFSGCGGCYNDDSQSISTILVPMDVEVLYWRFFLRW